MYELHAVLVATVLGLKKAREEAQKFIKDDNKTFYRTTANQYRFRHIPKQKFSDFKAKKINDKITLIFGKKK